ncbi:MAG: DNA methyltransferase [Armatimonadia bacterium]
MDDPVHPKNALNDLPNRQWLIETKSFWLSGDDGNEAFSELAGEFVQWLRQTDAPEEVERLLGQLDDSFVYSQAPPRSALKALHPATFSERDVERLIRLFTKQGERVLDPFVGSGSALLACALAGRKGVGIELSPEWAQVARERLQTEAVSGQPQPSLELSVVEGDARSCLQEMEADSFDFVVTSPPYWSILTKKAGLKAHAERTSRGLPTQYSDSDGDLGNLEDYDQFLDELARIFGQCGRVLKPKRYMAVIVSDFRHGPRFYLYHADLAARVEALGLQLKGVTILAQNNKNLYPFGIPFAFISNIHHQYILVFQKPAPAKPKHSKQG